MSEEAKNSKRNYRIIIYHGHLHKIHIKETGAKSKEENLVGTEEVID